jgi:hypothetical protein
VSRRRPCLFHLVLVALLALVTGAALAQERHNFLAVNGALV